MASMVDGAAISEATAIRGGHSVKLRESRSRVDSLFARAGTKVSCSAAARRVAYAMGRMPQAVHAQLLYKVQTFPLLRPAAGAVHSTTVISPEQTRAADRPVDSGKPGSRTGFTALLPCYLRGSGRLAGSLTDE